jgi:hypothetical protein
MQSSRDKDEHGFVGYILFVDFSSAFDTLQFDILLDILKQWNVTERLRKLVKFYLQCRTVNIYDQIINPGRGGPQGGKASPLLWDIYFSPLMKSMINKRVGTIRAYADDLVCYCKTQ